MPEQQEKSVETGLGLQGFLSKDKEADPPPAKAEEAVPEKAQEPHKEEAKADEAPKEDAALLKAECKKLSADNNRHQRRVRELEAKYRQDVQELTKVNQQLQGTYEEPVPDPELAKAQMLYRTRVDVSKANAVKKWGEEQVNELFLNDDSPWKQIENRFNDGDPDAIIANQRVRTAIDPFAEAYDIIEEEKLFTEYGTRSLPSLVEKAVEKRRETLEKEIIEKVRTGGQLPGAPVKTLATTRGGTEHTKPDSPSYRKFDEMPMFAHLSY